MFTVIRALLALVAGLLFLIPAAVSDLDRSQRDLPEMANDHGYVITKGRTVAPCRAPKHERQLVLLIAGQSNGANFLAGRPDYRASAGVVNFNAYDARCYVTKEPLLGAGGTHGSFIDRLGDMILNSGVANRVVIAPVALGSTSAADWSGALFPRISAAIAGLREQGLQPDIIILQQGEAEAMTPGYPPELYRSNIRKIVEKIRATDVDAPFYVAVSTTCQDITKVNADPIRKVQQGIADTELSIRVGPDTDRFGADDRTDGCHFNARGADLVAHEWFKAISLEQQNLAMRH